MAANIERTYDGERVLISDTAFRDCIFRECELVFDGRPVEMTGCTLEGCRWVFEGPAAYTIEFVQLMVTNEPDLRETWGKQLGFYDDDIARPVLLN